MKQIIFNIRQELKKNIDLCHKASDHKFYKKDEKIKTYEVFNYVMKHQAEMPRTALRYAIEKLPKQLKQKAMAK